MNSVWDTDTIIYTVSPIGEADATGFVSEVDDRHVVSSRWIMTAVPEAGFKEPAQA